MLQKGFLGNALHNHTRQDVMASASASIVRRESLRRSVNIRWPHMLFLLVGVHSALQKTTWQLQASVWKSFA